MQCYCVIMCNVCVIISSNAVGAWMDWLMCLCTLIILPLAFHANHVSVRCDGEEVEFVQPLNKELKKHYTIFLRDTIQIPQQNHHVVIKGQRCYQWNSHIAVMLQEKENTIHHFKVNVLYVQCYTICLCKKNNTVFIWETDIFC